MVPDVWHGLLLGLIVVAILVTLVCFTIIIVNFVRFGRMARALAGLVYQEGQRTRDAFREAR